MKDSETVNRTAFELEDVKVTLKEDINIAIKEMAVEGRQGEILNMPRWVAAILESDGLAEIQETVNMFDELKQAISKEQINGSFKLGTLEPDFYAKLNYQASRIPKEEAAKTRSELKRLFRLRSQKIIHYADSSKMTAEIASKLTDEEKEFYNRIDAVRDEFTKRVLGETR